MHIRFSCSRCHVRLTAELRIVGTPVVCPNCMSEIMVPSATEPRKPTDTYSPLVSAAPVIPESSPPCIQPEMETKSSSKSSRSRRRVIYAGIAAACVIAVSIGAYGFADRTRVDERNPDIAQAETNEHILSEHEILDADSEALVTNIGEFSSTQSREALTKKLLAAFDKDPAPSADDETTAERAEFGSTAGLQASLRLPKRPIEAALEVKRLNRCAENQHRRELAWVPEVRRLDRASMTNLIGGYIASYEACGRSSENMYVDPLVLMRQRPDLGYLPMRWGGACRMTPHQAATLGVLSFKLRAYFNLAAPRNQHDQRPDLATIKTALWYEKRDKKPEWLRAAAIPTIMQLLMHEDEPGRRMLVDLLDEIPEKSATIALAQRAVFDLSPSVREAAIRALHKRPADDYRLVLVRALRYPWAPAADHAAEALAALRDDAAIPLLITLLSRPDPTAPIPIGDSGRFGVREVARIHHVTNCLLCHPPATSTNDSVVGIQPGGSGILPSTPVTGQTAALALQGGGGGGIGGHNYGGGSGGSGSVRVSQVSRNSVSFIPTQLLIRGDVTYLRQDFSVLQYADVIGAPRERYDYCVRLRPLRVKELETRRAEMANQSTYPQREAVLFALRELTGRNLGENSEDWVALSGAD